MTKKRKNYITMRNQQIRLTEEDLHILVEDAVKIYLNEEQLNEWWGQDIVGGVKNAWNNMRTNYRLGKWASAFSNYSKQAQNCIEGMINIADTTKNTGLSQTLTNIKTNLETVATNFNKMARGATSNPNMNVEDPWQVQQQANEKKWQSKVNRYKNQLNAKNIAKSSSEAVKQPLTKTPRNKNLGDGTNG